MRSHSYGKISIGNGGAAAKNVLDNSGSTGWSTAGREGEANRLVVNFAKPFSPQKPWTIKLLFERHFAAALGHFRLSVSARSDAKASIHSANLEAALFRQHSGSGELTAAQRRQLQTFVCSDQRIMQKPSSTDRKASQTVAGSNSNFGDA